MDVGGEGFDYFFGGVVDDGDGAVLRVGDPDFFLVGREVEAFGAVAYGDYGLVPVGAGGGRARHVEGLHVDEAYGAGAYVGGDDVLEVGRDVDHVRAVLAGAEDPVDFLSGGVEAADGLGGFGGEVELAADEGEAVRAAEGAEVDGGPGLVVDEVEDGEGMEGSEAVVGDVGGGAVGGGDDLVGVGTYGEGVEGLEGGGVDDGESVVVLGEREERGLRVRKGSGGEAKSDESCGGAERGSHARTIRSRAARLVLEGEA